MDDYISKSDLLNQLESDNSLKNARKLIQLYIQDAPTVDAVPVVRCSECVNRGKKYQCPMMKSPDDTYYGSWQDDTEDDDFCSYGERKGEQN